MSVHRGRKPVDPHVVMAEVVATKEISPHLVRVTLGRLDRFTPVGYDQWFRLFLPRAGQDVLQLPTRASTWGWYVQYLATSRTKRPWVRNYTVRSARPDLHEIDVDLVVHADADGHSGPASNFATNARPGDEVGLLDQGVSFDVARAHERLLLVGDETALPALAGICESLPDDARGTAVVEVPTTDDRQDVRTPAGVHLRWVAREETTGIDAVPGQAALAAVKDLALPDGVEYAFVAGESALATGTRRHLVNERGVAKSQVDFQGYWRFGRASPS